MCEFDIMQNIPSDVSDYSNWASRCVLYSVENADTSFVL